MKRIAAFIATITVVMLTIAPTGASELTERTAPMRHHPHAATMWWVIFNSPEACVGNPTGQEKCSPVDLFGEAYLNSVAAGAPDPSVIAPNLASQPAVLYATGAVSNPRNGAIRFAASIYRTSDGALNLSGAQSVDPMGLGNGFFNLDAEFHLVVRDHGRARYDGRIMQVTNFLEPYCSDPRLGFEAGSNLCQDIQYAVFAPAETGQDGVYAFSDGLMLSGSAAHLYRQGDVVQAVIETRIPDRVNKRD